MNEQLIAAIHAAIEAFRAIYNQNEGITILRKTDPYVLVLSEKIGFVSFEFDIKNFLEHPDYISMVVVEIKTQKEVSFQVLYLEYMDMFNSPTELAFYERYIERYIQEINQQETNQQ